MILDHNFILNARDSKGDNKDWLKLDFFTTYMSTSEIKVSTNYEAFQNLAFRTGNLISLAEKKFILQPTVAGKSRSASSGIMRPK